MNVRREDMLRYLGSAGLTPDEWLTARMDEAVAETLAASSPRHVYRRLPLTDSLPLSGNDVREALGGCREAVFFAFTLGTGPEEREARAFARGDSLGAALIDAAASCLIESYCDDVCEQIAKDENVTLTLRYSCGYGDWDLARQADVLRLLDAQRRIGLHVSAGGVMVTQKSVTAVAGVLADGYSPAARSSHTADKCARCAALSCPYRKAPASYGKEE